MLTFPIATWVYQWLIFSGGDASRPGFTSACGPARGELLFRAPLRTYAVAQQSRELLCRNRQGEARTFGHEVVVVSICQRSLETIWKRCPFPRLEDGNSMRSSMVHRMVRLGATVTASKKGCRRKRLGALWFVLQGGQHSALQGKLHTSQFQKSRHLPFEIEECPRSWWLRTSQKKHPFWANFGKTCRGFAAWLPVGKPRAIYDIRWLKLMGFMKYPRKLHHRLITSYYIICYHC